MGGLVAVYFLICPVYGSATECVAKYPGQNLRLESKMCNVRSRADYTGPDGQRKQGIVRIVCKGK